MTAAARYSALVQEHFDRPHNAGRFEPGPGVIEASAGRAEQGVAFHLSARAIGGTLEAVRFEAYGCPHCIAAASWLSDQLSGRTVEDLERWHWQQAAQTLEVPAEKHGRLLVLEDAVRRLAEAIRRSG